MDTIDNWLQQNPRQSFEQIARLVNISRPTLDNYRKDPVRFRTRLLKFKAQEKTT